MKIYISVDMEGITSLVHFDEALTRNTDFQYFRKFMTEEANAAIEGALAAGATEIIVRDAHNTARNLLPDMLHPEAKLLREWSRSPYQMMEGIDDSFDAVLCVGYHAKASTPNGTLKHTMTGEILNVSVNGISLPELGWNGLIAGYHNVPVIFVAGDQAICDQANQLFQKIETVAVKQGIGQATLSVHPKKAQSMIRNAVERACKSFDQYTPLIYDAPYTIEISFKNELNAFRASWYPGAKRADELSVTLTCNDFFDCMRFFIFVT
ncbi:M55 family metallopeptidase [candidate division KSB1 bacterium]|nr:M55 family metallopeptidase [candidate division KSB1 bacterium]